MRDSQESRPLESSFSLPLPFPMFICCRNKFLPSLPDPHPDCRGHPAHLSASLGHPPHRGRQVRAAFPPLLNSFAHIFFLPCPDLLILLSLWRGRRVRYLLLPWLIMFGLLQVALLCSILLAVLHLPQEFKLLSVAIAAFEVRQDTDRLLFE